MAEPSKERDGASLVAGLAGISRPEALVLWEKVRANQERLAACPYHEFEPEADGDGPGSSVFARYACARCGGTVDRSAYHWHEAGRRPRP